MASDVIGLKKVLSLLDPKKIARATRNAINAVAAEQKKVSVKEIVGEYNIKAKRVRGDITTKRARSATDEAVVSYGIKRPGLLNFTPNRAGVNRPGGPKVRIRKGGSLDRVERGFFATPKRGAGARAIFQREGTKRLPINRRTGPSVKQMYEDNKVIKRVEPKILNEFSKQFDEKLRAQTGR